MAKLKIERKSAIYLTPQCLMTTIKVKGKMYDAIKKNILLIRFSVQSYIVELEAKAENGTGSRCKYI